MAHPSAGPAAPPGALRLVLLVSPEDAERLAFASAFASSHRGARAAPTRPGLSLLRSDDGRASIRPRSPDGQTRSRPVSILQAIVLGIMQGATEFAPVSSSGHLIIVPWMFGWPMSATRTSTRPSTSPCTWGRSPARWSTSDTTSRATPGVVRIDRRAAGSLDRRTPGLGAGDRDDPGVDRRGDRSRAHPGRARAPWLIAVMLVVFGIVLYVVDRVASSRRISGIWASRRSRARHRAGARPPAGRLALGCDDDGRPRAHVRPGDRGPVLVPALAAGHRGRGAYKGLDLAGEGSRPGWGGRSSRGSSPPP